MAIRRAGRKGRPGAPRISRRKGLAPAMHRKRSMFDLVFIAVTIGFFALGVAYTRGCDHL